MSSTIPVPPPATDYSSALERVIRALLDDGREAGARALEPIAYPRREIAKRPSLGRVRAGEVFRRDRFRCRYCGVRVIPTPIMELVGNIYPDGFPFHPNWKGGLTHPAIPSQSCVVDHVDPGSGGGDWLALGNLVTACWPCNARKGDLSLARLNWALLPVPENDGWDGLVGYYEALWAAAGKPKPSFHSSWMEALR